MEGNLFCGLLDTSNFSPQLSNCRFSHTSVRYESLTDDVSAIFCPHTEQCFSSSGVSSPHRTRALMLFPRFILRFTMLGTSGIAANISRVSRAAEMLDRLQNSAALRTDHQRSSDLYTDCEARFSSMAALIMSANTVPGTSLNLSSSSPSV